MAKCFPQQFIHGMKGGAVQNWVFALPKRGLWPDKCSVHITNETLEEQDIDTDDCSSIDIYVPARKRNISVSLSDINYNLKRINFVRERSGKVYFTAINGGSLLIRGWLQSAAIDKHFTKLEKNRNNIFFQ